MGGRGEGTVIKHIFGLNKVWLKQRWLFSWILFFLSAECLFYSEMAGEEMQGK